MQPNEWINLKDKQPKLGQQVLAGFKGQFHWVYFVATMTRYFGLWTNGYASPTHWQPLPEPPKEN